MENATVLDFVLHTDLNIRPCIHFCFTFALWGAGSDPARVWTSFCLFQYMKFVLALSSSAEASTCSQPSQSNGNDGCNDSDIFYPSRMLLRLSIISTKNYFVSLELSL